ncbi:MAG: Unknown protein, partial [uncultured Sulfurovum sp.]
NVVAITPTSFALTKERKERLDSGVYITKPITSEQYNKMYKLGDLKNLFLVEGDKYQIKKSPLENHVEQILEEVEYNAKVLARKKFLLDKIEKEMGLTKEQLKLLLK